jgi:hypothetical protein
MIRRSSTVLQQILALDPVKDHQRIMFLSCRCDFPFDTTRSLELALFRTFVVPSIGFLLDRTGEFGKRTQKRYDDTDLILSEIVEYGYDSERGSRAIARMNELHGRFRISNADFLYVLSTFVFEPIRWNARFGWRRMCRQERLAMFYFWREVGRRMHIRDVPADYDGFEALNQAYEAEHFRSNAASWRVADSTLRMFASWAPEPLQWVVPPVMRAVMDKPLLDALNFAPAPEWLRALVGFALRARGRIAHAFGRGRPRFRTGMRHRTYPAGYVIEALGPSVPDKQDRPAEPAGG